MEQGNPSASLEGSSGPGLLCQTVPSPGVWAPAWPIWPIPSEVRQPSPPLVVPTLPPFTQLLIALHKEVLVTPFTTFTFLLGKWGTLLAQEQTFRLQKKSCLSLEEGRPWFGLGKWMQRFCCRSCMEPPGHGGTSFNRTAKLLLDSAKTELRKLMGERRGGLCGLKSPKSPVRANTFGCIPPEVQDAFAPTLGFSAIGVCAGQVEGGAHNCWFFGSLGSQIVQRTKKRQNRFASR